MLYKYSLTYFSAEVYHEILLRLPVKTLLRCTSVCPSWNSLITSASFITIHLNRTTISANTLSNTNNDLLLLRQYLGRHDGKRYSLHRDNQTLDECVPLDFLFQARGFDTASKGVFTIVGSCNGLLCLFDGLMVLLTHLQCYRTLQSENPSPFPDPISRSTPTAPIRLLLDLGNDYKVVRLMFLEVREDGDEAVPVVELYSLSTGAWRRISAAGSPDTVPEPLWSQAFMNGAVHWLAFRGNTTYENLILSFDLGDEIFGKMELLANLVSEHAMDLSIVEFRESLSVFTHAWKRKSGSIWVMREYGVAESWSKQFTIPLIYKEEFCRPLWLRENGEILVAIRIGKLVSYHPKMQRITDLAICGSLDSFYVNTNVDSLVLLQMVN